MSTQTINTRSTMFMTGWIVLLVISTLATLNHFMLPIYGDDILLAIGWAGYSLYATLVIAIPFRHGERWAWYTSWILVTGFVVPILMSRESIAVAYLVLASIMAVCLLLTRPAFFRQG